MTEMTDIASVARREVHARVEKAADLEIHVSTLFTEVGEFSDIREYVPSLGQYARGVTFPISMKKDISAGLRKK